MYSNKPRQLGTLIGDELLDSSGILIPKKEEFYIQQEKKEPVEIAPVLYPVQRIKTITLEDKLGLRVEPNPKTRQTRIGTGKRAVPYDIGLIEIKEEGYDRFLLFSEIVEIGRLAYSGDKDAGRLYSSLTINSGDEWLGLVMERRGKDLIFYEEAEGIKMEAILLPSGGSKRKTVIRYNSSKISCKDSRVFEIGDDKISGMDIPLSLFGPAMIGYLIGCDLKDYPQKMPGPVICLPPDKERVPVGFAILKDRIKINGDAVYRGFRGVKKIIR